MSEHVWFRFDFRDVRSRFSLRSDTLADVAYLAKPAASLSPATFVLCVSGDRTLHHTRT